MTDDPQEKRARPRWPLRLNLLTDDPFLTDIFMDDYEHDFMKTLVNMLIFRTEI